MLPVAVSMFRRAYVGGLSANLADERPGGRPQSNGIPAEFINSTLSPEEISRIQARAKRNQTKILYLAPERLALSGFRDFLHGLQVSLIAIDEAHCISEWGHDFRQDYRNLKSLRSDFPSVPVIALTATATERVREDIALQLDLTKARTYLSSFNRANLKYVVEPKKDAFSSLLTLLEDMKMSPQSYTASLAKIPKTWRQT